MSRSYRAAKRRVQAKPIEFDYTYDVDVENRDDEGKPLPGTHEEERSVHFVCKGEVSTLLLSELAYNADLDLADPEAVKLVRAFFSQAFGVRSRLEEDAEGVLREFVVQDEAHAAYQKFLRLHTMYGNDDLLMDIMSGLVEDFMGRPTQEPSLSLEPEPSAGASSKVVSLSRGTVQMVEGEVVGEGSPTASSG